MESVTPWSTTPIFIKLCGDVHHITGIKWLNFQSIRNWCPSSSVWGVIPTGTNTVLYSLWHGSKQSPNVILQNFLPCLKHMLCQFMKIGGWRLVRAYTSSHLIPDMFNGWPGRPVKDLYILQGVSGVNCIILLEYAIWYPGHEGYHNRVYHSCHILASIQSPFSKYQIRPVVISNSSPHHDSRSWREMHFDNRCFLWPFTRVVYGHVGVDLTATNRMPLNVLVDSGSTPCKSLLSVVRCQR